MKLGCGMPNPVLAVFAAFCKFPIAKADMGEAVGGPARPDALPSKDPPALAETDTEFGKNMGRGAAGLMEPGGTITAPGMFKVPVQCKATV